jgi:hypothetical protein
VSIFHKRCPAESSWQYQIESAGAMQSSLAEGFSAQLFAEQRRVDGQSGRGNHGHSAISVSFSQPAQLASEGKRERYIHSNGLAVR